MIFFSHFSILCRSHENIFQVRQSADHEFREIITLHDENDEVIDSLPFCSGNSFANPAQFSPALEDREKADLEEQLSSWVSLSELEPDVKCNYDLRLRAINPQLVIAHPVIVCSSRATDSNRKHK